MTRPLADDITIRPAESITDYRACQEAQRLSWGLGDEAYVVPIATMVGAQLHGGLVLGAFLPDGRAVGLSFAFLGRVEGRECLYSQLTGLVPGYQDRGLGTTLKLAQRDHALRLGVEVIAWAFDPLQAGNARFNLDKLGATAGRYVVDMYGPRTDRLNQGTPTDRLVVEWSVNPRPRPTLPTETFPRLLEPRRRPDGSVEVFRRLDLDDAPGLRIEVPEEIAALRRSDPDSAAGWLLAVRDVFRWSFARGYRAVGFARSSDGPRNRAEYVLVRDSEN